MRGLQCIHTNSTHIKHTYKLIVCGSFVSHIQEILLLPNQVLAEQQSIIVIKKLLAIAVSGITYLRGLFPEKAYGRKYVEDQKVMILREEHSCPGAIQIVQWMEGCFEAIEKKYLRSVIISIYTDPENPKVVTEYYQFRIQYTSHGAQMDFESKSNDKMSNLPCGNMKKASILLVRKLYVMMQNLGPLPENVFLKMKLAYYNDVTPQNYQPPGFMEADGDTMEFEREPIHLSMGEVVTPFHSIKLDMGTERQRLEQMEMMDTSQKWFLRIEEEGISLQGHVTEDVEELDKENTNTVIQMGCEEKMEEHTEVDEGESSDKNMVLRRTRSGLIIKSTMVGLTHFSFIVSKYEIPNSQETPSTSVAKKKRKFSEPKEHF
ncbi:unnamed protein product [Lampetra planeri]